MKRILSVVAILACTAPFVVSRWAGITRAQVAQPNTSSLQMTVQLGDVDFTKIVAAVAYDQGLYVKNGLVVQQYISKGASEVAKSRGVTVPEWYVRDIPHPTVLITGGVPLIVYRTTNANWMDDRIILASMETVIHSKIMGRPEIANIESLKEKRLGYTSFGDMTHFTLLSVAQKMGWNPLFDISMISQGTAPEAVKQGHVDGFVASEVPQAMALAAGLKPIAELRMLNLPIAGSGVIVSRAWLNSNRDAALRFMKAMVEAIAMIKKDQNVAFRSTEKWYGISDPKIQEILYNGHHEMPAKPYPAVVGIKKTMELYDSREMRKYKPEDFYDDSIVRELDKSGFIDKLYK